LPSLGHASYVCSPDQTGEALVLDAHRDVAVYFEFGQANGLSIRYAVDTHQHNDYLSGIIELKQRGSVDLLAAARV
jgi:hydroxyacylglutathione hydrolase